MTSQSQIERMDAVLKNRYKIPPMQRDYVWKTQQIKEFWKDMVTAKDSTEIYHFGTIVVYKDKDTYAIVDGQQRMTTAYIFLSAIKEKLLELKKTDCTEDDLYKIDTKIDMIEGYIGKPGVKTSYKMIVDPKNRTYFEKCVIGCSSDTPDKKSTRAVQNMYAARKTFVKEISDKFKEFSTISEKVDFLCDIATALDDTEVVKLGRDSKTDANRIFYRINSRGVRLNASDLIKNHLYTVCDPEWTGTTEATADWNYIDSHLKSKDFNKYLAAYWQSKHGRVTSDKLYETIIDTIGDDEDKAREMIAEMRDNLDLYNYLLDPENVNRPSEMKIEDCEDELIKLIKMFNHSTYVPPLLAVYSTIQSSKARRVILHNLVTYTIRVSVTEGLFRAFDEGNNGFCENLTNAKDETTKRNLVNAYINTLAKCEISDEKFALSLANFTAKTSEQKRKVKAMLRHLCQTESFVIRDTVQLEHILPENADIDTVWDDFLLTHDRYFGKLGNFTLLDASTNDSISNGCFEDKKRAYATSSIDMTKNLTRYDKWNMQTIDTRTEELAMEIARHWSFKTL